MAAAVEVLPCPPELRTEALKLVLRELSPEQQVALVTSLQSAANRGADPFEALIVAKQERRLSAATWAQLQPGRVATLWIPQFISVYDEAVARELIEVATKTSATFDVSMFQAILAGQDSESAKSLLAAGFSQAADLIYLEWIPADPEEELQPLLEFEAYNERHHDRLATLLGQTYQGSLDCPQLDSIRTLDDTIEGYRATGDFDPKLWSIARDGTQDVGVVLLTKYANTRQMELIYMGVVPAARGQGVGAALIRQAQRIAAQHACKKLLLAVDSANEFALQLYRAAGFQEWSRRSVYIFNFARVG